MEKDQFLSLVKNYTSLNKEEALELIALQRHYPYSQVLHHLCSRGARDCQLDARETLLHRSAIYATERAVLKSIMTAVRTDRPTIKSPSVTRSAVVEVTAEPISVTPKNEPGAAEQLRSDLMVDLDRLQLMKDRFEKTVEELDKASSLVSGEAKKKIRKTTDEPEAIDSIIEEIKTNKKKFKPEGPRQKEQIEIIENFIKTQPTINKGKLAAPPTDGSDLAEQSLVYGDNIVSETLVEILLKQGKKDKAIEVLKKLIWKIPQKKAYFAAQIEELKKN